MKNICIKNKEEFHDFSGFILSILLTQGGFSYSVYSTTENRYNVLVARILENKNEYVNELKSFLEDEELSNKNFDKINISVANNRNTIVPCVLFSENQYKELFYLNFGIPENQEILYTKLTKSANTLIYSVDNNLVDFLKTIFPKHKLYSHASSFIETNFIKNKIRENRENAKVFVQVFESFIDILVFRNEKIELYNSFDYKTNNDILYHIVNVFEQLKLSQEETEVSVSGFIETDNIAIIHLRKFVRMVYFEPQNMDFIYFYKFQETLPHYFVNFLNIVKCE
ncbi:DUF3822 family protein [Bacteroidales bacterium OttesenSCG-928-I21]|nr:DUF3822 family protein [Bacteroidales bacterium OttesenSCG-928-I21]